MKEKKGETQIVRPPGFSVSLNFGDAVSASVTLPPAFVLSTIVTLERSVESGHVVRLLAPSWRMLADSLERDPGELLNLDPRWWEEVVAASYDAAGFDEVILTPRSGDGGRDVIATTKGWGSVRILDQVKRYAPDHKVTAEEVRAMLGVLTADQAASKGVVTTTSDFAPRVRLDRTIAPFLPTRLELVNGTELFARLKALSKT